MPKKIEMFGRNFGRLTVIGKAKKCKDGLFKYLCKCSCGNQKLIYGHSLRSGATKSCGCLAKELTKKRLKKQFITHGQAGTSIYNIWAQMLQRCFNKNHKSYRYYGGRGITVCDSWKNDFGNFYADMGEKPERLTLERKDNNKGYSPDNCKWATIKEQKRNTRRNKIITFNNKTQCLTDWAKELTINKVTLRYRLSKYPPQIAFNM